VVFLIHTRPFAFLPSGCVSLVGQESCLVVVSQVRYHYAEGLCVAHTQACQQSIILGDVLLLHTAADTPFLYNNNVVYTSLLLLFWRKKGYLPIYLDR